MWGERPRSRPTPSSASVTRGRAKNFGQSVAFPYQFLYGPMPDAPRISYLRMAR